MAYYSNSAPFRLRIYLKQNRNSQVFIGYPLANPTEWIQIFNFNSTELICGKERFDINDVRSFIIACDFFNAEFDRSPSIDGWTGLIFDNATITFL